MPKRDPVLAALGQNVRQRRETRELSPEKLAGKAGLVTGDPEFKALATEIAIDWLK